MLIIDFLRNICDVELYGSGIGDIGDKDVVMDEQQLVNYRRLISLYNRVCSQMFNAYPFDIGEVEIPKGALPITVPLPERFNKVLAILDAYSNTHATKATGDHTKFGIEIEAGNFVINKILFRNAETFQNLFPFRVFYDKHHRDIDTAQGLVEEVPIPVAAHNVLSYGIAYYATLTPDAGSEGGQNTYGRLYFKGLNSLYKTLGIKKFGNNTNLHYKRGYEQ